MIIARCYVAFSEYWHVETIGWRKVEVCNLSCLIEWRVTSLNRVWYYLYTKVWQRCTVKENSSMLSARLAAHSVVLDRVRHFRLIPIHRFFAVNRIRYRYDTDFLIRFKSGCGAAWLTDQRLQTPPPQLITAVRRGPVAAWRRMPLICPGQSNTATISKV